MATGKWSKTLIALAIAGAFGLRPVIAQDQPESGATAESNPSAPSEKPDSLGSELDFLLDDTASEPATPATTAPQPEAAATPAPTSQPETSPAEPAQDPADPIAESESETRAQLVRQARSSAIEEIVVTARRTAENVQDVPIAITAMSSEDLRREQINSPQDLQGRVPSLVVGPNNQMRNTETPTVRGQGSQFGAPPGVVMYMSEVPLVADPIANYQGGPGKFFDLANVQVLKGSQGTLFGRNTTGGAMLLEPQKPTDEVYGSVSVGATSLSGRSYEGVVNTPMEIPRSSASAGRYSSATASPGTWRQARTTTARAIGPVALA
jgi:iron complex outermembrane receptor protein